jgi:hypothetical protein
VAGIYLTVSFLHGGHAFLCILELVNGQPFSNTGRTFLAESLMQADGSIEDIYLLYAHGIAGAHNGGDIVRVVHILHYDGQFWLPVVEDLVDPCFTFGCHGCKNKIWNSGFSRNYIPCAYIYTRTTGQNQVSIKVNMICVAIYLKRAGGSGIKDKLR